MSWYNKERVSQPGSVILQQWNAERQVAKQAAQEAALNKAAYKRVYGGAAVNRLNGDWPVLNTSADSEILTSLRILRARSRELCRDNEYAKNAIRIIKNNVIGSGIGMQAMVSSGAGKLQKRINDQIEAAHSEWCCADTCDPAGKLTLPDMERLIVGSLAENGEVLVREVRQPFGSGRIPYALELIEADRLADQWSSVRASNGNHVRMGVEMNQWGRPVAYWLYPTHPGDYQFSAFVESALLRVPAEDMIHLYIPDRIGQTRGVPWFHATLKRMRHLSGYEEAEVVAARAAASVVGIVTTADLSTGVDDDEEQEPEPEISLQPGTVQRLLPGEQFTGFNPSRNNAGLDPFMRYMLRAVAAGVGLSYESLSRDYSKGSYSSSRLSLLEDRDNWRALQGWFIRNFRMRVYQNWLTAAVLAGELSFPDFYSNIKKYQRVRFRPRGWSWIDPTKEVAAYRMAVRAGFMTVTDVIGMTSEHADAEDVFNARAEELAAIEELGLVFDTDPGVTDNKGAVQAGESVNEMPEPDPDADPDDPDAQQVE